MKSTNGVVYSHASFANDIQSLDFGRIPTKDLVTKYQEMFVEHAKSASLKPFFRQVKESKLLLIAAHATEHWRRVRGKDDKRGPDDFTAGVVLAIAQKLNASFLIATGQDEEWLLPWSERNDEFAIRLRELSLGFDGLVIDFHGFADTSTTGDVRNFDLDIGTGTDHSMAIFGNLLAKFVNERMGPEFRACCNAKFAGKGQFTVTHFLQSDEATATNCIQIELSRNMRLNVDGGLDCLIDAFCNPAEGIQGFKFGINPESVLSLAPISSKSGPFKGINVSGKNAPGSVAIPRPTPCGTSFEWAGFDVSDEKYMREGRVRDARIESPMRPDEVYVSSDIYSYLKREYFRGNRTSAREWVYAIAVNPFVPKNESQSSTHYPVAMFRVGKQVPSCETSQVHMHHAARNLMRVETNKDTILLAPLSWNPNKIQITKASDKAVRHQLHGFFHSTIVLPRRLLRTLLIWIAGAPQLQLTAVRTSNALEHTLDRSLDVGLSKWDLQALGAKSNQQIILEWLGKRHRVTAFELPENPGVPTEFPVIEIPAAVRASLGAPVGAAISVSRSMRSLVLARLFLVGAFATGTFFGTLSVIHDSRVNEIGSEACIATIWALVAIFIAVVLGLIQERMPKSSALDLGKSRYGRAFSRLKVAFFRNDHV